MAADPNATVAAADIAVTTVPEYPGFAAFLDPARLRPGGLAVGVDLGRSWLPAGLGHFATVATDDAAQSAHLVEEGRLNAPATFDADLAALTTGAGVTHTADKRAFFVFAGHVLGDLAAAAAVYQRACDSGIGTRLPL
ncbi:MAG: hypothetical protein JO001_15750 [Alphaproteobacteria bacterium]|nr:hypothetical protein [Alphaproteobacteria bacterium]